MALAIHIMNELKPSGMEKMFESSFDCWQKRGWEIIIVGSGSQHPFAQSLRNVGYRVILIPKLKSVSGIIQLISVLRRNKSEIVHNHSESMHGFISVISWLFSQKSPIVRTIHNCFQFNGIAKQTRKIQHFMETRVGVARVSPSADVQLNERNNWKVYSDVIENWIDIERIKALDLKNNKMNKNEHLLISIVGNCNIIKDHSFALEVISDFNEIEVFHIGQQSQITNEELSILSILNDKSKLLWNGPSDRVLEIFSYSDVHILSSIHEGFGLVVAESVVLGIDTWIRDVPGVQWARGLPGVKFFETQSDLRRLISEKIETNFVVSRDSHIRNEEAERFSPARGVRQYTDLYYSLIAKPDLK